MLQANRPRSEENVLWPLQNAVTQRKSVTCPLENEVQRTIWQNASKDPWAVCMAVSSLLMQSK